MENNKTLKVLLLFVIILIAANLLVSLFNTGEIQSTKKELKQAKELITSATQHLAKAQLAIDSLQAHLAVARTQLNGYNQEVAQLNASLKNRIGQLDNNIDNMLAEMRKKHLQLKKLQEELNKLEK